MKRHQPAASLLVVTLCSGALAAGTTFTPTFCVLSRSDSPGYRMKREPTTNYEVPVWKSPNSGKDTYSLFDAARIEITSASQTERISSDTKWMFPETEESRLEAVLHQEPGPFSSMLTFRFTPKVKAWYSIGYAGCNSIASESCSAIWQPLVWQEQRFPQKSFLSIESMCSLPAALIEVNGTTFGVVADPAEGPYRLPTAGNSRYGVLVRNPAGEAQPMLFAPVLGGADSLMEAGQTYSFSMRLVERPGSYMDAFRALATELYGFHDYRENYGCSLNTTIENMIDFAMNDALSGWVADLRGSDYATDVPGTVKNVSALHPLSIALITDSADIYRRRALPMTEYLLSRQKYLFATREEITGQGASHLMRGPAAEVSELVALSSVFGSANQVFAQYAQQLFDKPRALNLNMVSAGGTWQNALALYRLTHHRAYLERAVAGANDYVARRVDKPQRDFSDVHVETGGQFWTDYAPKWVDLFELYEETSDTRYLQSAHAGANEYAMYVWLHPRIPDGDVLVNKGGSVQVSNKRQIRDPQPMRVPEQLVPAWQVSQIGLTPEASRTHVENPAIMLAQFAPYMLRVGQVTGDRFLHDVARSSIVGRYQNFPGYDINGQFTNVFSRPDYPLHAYRELTYNNIYYNHVWPHIALLMDYLVSDAETRSSGKIHFPSQYAQGYAYLASKVYGDRTGSFYGRNDVHLWMPRRLLTTDKLQVNYVTGYDANSLYVALLNQSARDQAVTVEVNPSVVPISSERLYPARLLSRDGSSDSMALEHGRIAVQVPASGITALAIDGIQVSPQFQASRQETETSDTRRFAVQQTPAGKVTSMLLSLGPDNAEAYTWLEATEHEASGAILHFVDEDGETTRPDFSYPYEFSIPLLRRQKSVELWVDTVTSAGNTMSSGRVTLVR